MKDKTERGQPNADRINPATPDPEGFSHGGKGFGSRPVVGQGKSYVSGANAHGKHEKPTRSNTTAGDSAASQPHQGSWTGRPPTKSK